ncbi:MAG TPA: DinB family protein [Phnomibacter sp.]|nr:DinB family protein [Phnomibacter sp.]
MPNLLLNKQYFGCNAGDFRKAMINGIEPSAAPIFSKHQNEIFMKEILSQYAAYNVWANHKLLFQMQQMEEEKWYQQTPSSFNSLFKTVLHMWDAESIWFQRLRLHEKLVVPSATFDPSFKDACNGLLHQCMEWEPFIAQALQDDGVQSKLAYKTSQGVAYEQPVAEILMHVFNHSTYHRGQLVTMMRQLGETSLPVTDFIAFTRKSA